MSSSTDLKMINSSILNNEKFRDNLQTLTHGVKI